MPPPTPTTRAPLLFQVTIAAPADVVFRAFFEQPERWLCREASVEPRVGGALRLSWPDGLVVVGQFVQLEPPTTARLRWCLEGDPLPETMVVAWTRSDERQGAPVTWLEVEHYGFGGGPDWEPLYVGAARAWAGYLKNLRSVLETGADLREADE